MFCTNCGKEIPENSRFCPNCGTAAIGAPSKAPAAAAPGLKESALAHRYINESECGNNGLQLALNQIINVLSQPIANKEQIADTFADAYTARLSLLTNQLFSKIKYGDRNYRATGCFLEIHNVFSTMSEFARIMPCMSMACRLRSVECCQRAYRTLGTFAKKAANLYNRKQPYFVVVQRGI